MFLVNIPFTKAEGECHSSIFYGLFENEKMNERHVTTTRNTAENMEMVFLFQPRLEQRGVVVICNVVENECGRRDTT
jgi:hypothetical protein